MTISRKIIEHLETRPPGRGVIAALETLLATDLYLLQVDANERSISHRFGMYLQQELPNYSVDCEYNRDGVEPKRIGYLELHPDAEDTESKTVFPDIVAHVRGERQNYLVIEFKKSSSTVSRDVDFQKLRGYNVSGMSTHFSLSYPSVSTQASPAQSGLMPNNSFKPTPLRGAA